MIVAIVTVHWKIGYFVFRPGQGIEYCLTIAIVAGVVGALGPGRWSLDHALGWWHYSRLDGLLIAVGARARRRRAPAARRVATTARARLSRRGRPHPDGHGGDPGNM